MDHLPYGYNVVEGVVVIDETKAANIQKLFHGYLSGLSLSMASKQANIDTYHGTVGNLLRNKHYLGDEYYPMIIDKETFDAVEQERQDRASRLGRIREVKPKESTAFSTKFHLGKFTQKFQNPFEQAQYVYSLVESEVSKDD